MIEAKKMCRYSFYSSVSPNDFRAVVAATAAREQKLQGHKEGPRGGYHSLARKQSHPACACSLTGPLWGTGNRTQVHIAWQIPPGTQPHVAPAWP